MFVGASKLPGHSRSGYTLLELVLAAGLSTLVMLGVSGVILLIYRTEATGSRQVTAVEIGHNVVRWLAADLQSIPGIYPETPAATDTPLDTSEQLRAADEQAETFAAPTETEPLTAFALMFVGTANSLSFVAEPIVRPRRNMLDDSTDMDSDDPVVDESSRRRLLLWGLADAATLMMPTYEDPDEQFVRVETYVDADTTVTAFGETVAVAELLEMQFSYFDGTDWVAEWDSETLEALPKAVEVTLTIALSQDESGDPSPTKALTIRRVIAIPTQRFVAAPETDTEL